MPKYAFGQLKTGRPEERRPVDRVETGNVLTNQVQVCWPVFGEKLPVSVRVAQASQVVSQRVHPHVHNVLIITGYGHAPVEGGARN